MAKPNLPVLALALAWWLIETSYFGWHAFPTSLPGCLLTASRSPWAQ